MKRGKILITERIHPILEEELRAAGWECRYLEQTTQEEVLELIVAYDGLVVRSGIKVDKALIDRAEKLRFVGRTGSGMEHIDTLYCEQKGILCLNSPAGNCDSVGEQVVGMLLGLLHNIVKADGELRQKYWNRKANRGEELMGKTVGIIGFGHTGSAVARRLSGFGVHILAYDRFKAKGYAADLEGVEEATLDLIFEKADVVTFHIPLNDTTYQWVDASFLAQFKKPIYLINASRGGILDTKAGLAALEKKRLKGLALDVFEKEDMQAFGEKDWEWFDKLIENNNIIITPHIAGVSTEAFYKVAYILAKKINRLL